MTIYNSSLIWCIGKFAEQGGLPVFNRGSAISPSHGLYYGVQNSVTLLYGATFPKRESKHRIIFFSCWRSKEPPRTSHGVSFLLKENLPRAARDSQEASLKLRVRPRLKFKLDLIKPITSHTRRDQGNSKSRKPLHVAKPRMKPTKKSPRKQRETQNGKFTLRRSIILTYQG